jgi:hypothetical protein
VILLKQPKALDAQTLAALLAEVTGCNLVT